MEVGEFLAPPGSLHTKATEPHVFVIASQGLDTPGCLSLVTNLDGTTSIVVDTNCVDPEIIELILESTDTATFNFVAEDVPVGVHAVAVQAPKRPV